MIKLRKLLACLMIVCMAFSLMPLAAFATEPTIATYMHQDTDNARVFARAGITPNVRYTSVDSRATFAMVQSSG